MHKSTHSTPGEALKSTLAKDETLEATEGVTAEENKPLVAAPFLALLESHPLEAAQVTEKQVKADP